MPRKKKDPNQMDDRELLSQVFPERIIRRVEEELGLRTASNDKASEQEPPDKG